MSLARRIEAGALALAITGGVLLTSGPSRVDAGGGCRTSPDNSPPYKTIDTPDYTINAYQMGLCATILDINSKTRASILGIPLWSTRAGRAQAVEDLTWACGNLDKGNLKAYVGEETGLGNLIPVLSVREVDFTLDDPSCLNKLPS